MNLPNPEWESVKAENNIIIQLHLLADGFARGCVLVDGKPSMSVIFEKDKPDSFIDMLVDHSKAVYKQSII